METTQMFLIPSDHIMVTPSEMKKLKDEFKELKNQLMNKLSLHEANTIAPRKPKLEDHLSHPYERKTKIYYIDDDSNFSLFLVIRSSEMSKQIFPDNADGYEINDLYGS